MNRILAHTSIIGTFSVATSSNTLFLIRNDGNVGIGTNSIDYSKLYLEANYSSDFEPEFAKGAYIKTLGGTYSKLMKSLKVGVGNYDEPWYSISSNEPGEISSVFSYINMTSSVANKGASLYAGVLYSQGHSLGTGLNFKITGSNTVNSGSYIIVSGGLSSNYGYAVGVSGTYGTTHVGLLTTLNASLSTDEGYKKYGINNAVTGQANENYGLYNVVRGAQRNYGVRSLLTHSTNNDKTNYGEYIVINATNADNTALYISVGGAGSTNSAIITKQGSSIFNDLGDSDSNFTVRSKNQEYMFYVDSGNDFIGIGTQSPAYDLEVAGGFKAKQIYMPNGTDQILSESGDAVLGFGTGYEFNFTNDGGVGNKGRIQVSDTQAIFGNTYGLIESYTTSGYLTHDQKWMFGIGLNYIMEVNSSGVSASGLSVGTNSNYSGHLLPTEDSAYDLGSSTKKWRSLHVTSGSIYIGGVTVSSSNGSIQIPSINLGTTENPVIITSQNNQVSFGPSTSTTFLTNVGMGTTGPSYSLHVVGTTSTTNLRITNGASSSFVLSSDSDGLASWTASYRSQMFSHGSFNPLDATTYYIGDIADLGPTTSNVVARRIKSQFAGSVISVTLLVAIGGTNGTNENTTFEIHNLTTATSSTITSTAQLTADFLTTYTLSTPLTVSANDDLQIRMICPTWVTNPTSVRGRFTARIKL